MQSLFCLAIRQECHPFVRPPWRLPSAETLCHDDVRQFVSQCRQLATCIGQQVDPAFDDSRTFEPNQGASQRPPGSWTDSFPITSACGMNDNLAARLPRLDRLIAYPACVNLTT
jgi:hypothetical protein